MTVAVWPTGVNLWAVTGSYNEKPDTNFTPFGPEVGPEKRRRRFTLSSDLVSFTAMMTYAEWTLFETWYRDTLKDGTLPFYRNRPRTGVMEQFIFSGDAPEAHDAADNLLEVALTMKNVPGTQVPSWVTVPNFILPDIDIDFASNLAWVKGPGVVSIPSILNVTRASPETVTDAAGNITYALSNAPAYSSAGLQSWETRTNLLTKSQNIASWASNNATITSNAAIAPDGTMTAGRLAATASSIETFVLNPTTFPTSAGQTFTLSGYCAPGTVGWVALQFVQGGNSVAAWFNLTTGVVGSHNAAGNLSFASATIARVSNGFYRISLTVTASGSNTAVQSAFIVSNADASIAISAGQSILIWGAQAEQEAVASPYIPTTTAAVARQADQVFLASPPTFGTSFTAKAGGSCRSLTSALSPNPCPLTISDGGVNNRLTLYTFSGGSHGIFLSTGGVARLNTNAGGSVAVGVPTKWAMSVSPTAIASAYDGTLGASAGAGVVPSVNAIEIGGVGQLGLGDQWNGNISRVTIWATAALPAAVLQAITA